MAKITIDSIEIQGFRSMTKPMVFKLPDKNGFYFLSGTNKANSELGANGVGKSSLWDALVFTFFGKSARGLRGPDLKTWLTEDMLATAVHFYVGKKLHIIRRTWSPNSLTLQRGSTNSPLKIEQDTIDQLLGCDYSLFLHVVLQGQFNNWFIDLPPTDKLKVWSQILNLDEWLARSKKAKSKLLEEQKALNEAEQAQARVLGILETLRASIASQRAIIDSEQKQSKTQLEDIRRDIAAAEKIANGGSSKLKELSKEQEAVDQKLEELKEEERALGSKAMKCQSKRIEISKKLAVLESELRRLKKDRDKYKETDSCPWCLQDIAEGHKTRMIKALSKKIRAIKDEVGELLEYGEGVNERQDKLEKKMLAIRRGLEDARTVGYSLLSKKTKILQDKERALFQITQLEREVQRLKESSKGTKELKRLKRELKEAKEGRRLCAKAVSDSNALLLSYKLWERSFKDIRLWLVNKALLELEMHVNNSFIELGLKGWAISFSVQHENKSGGVSKGLTALIKSPQQDRMVPWSSWSGGETQRIRIATAVGLLRMIQERTAFSCNLEVWDEPTEHLSKEGIEDLLSFFEIRQEEEKKQLWLVDHRALDFGGFTGSAHLSRSPSGIKVKYDY